MCMPRIESRREERKNVHRRKHAHVCFGETKINRPIKMHFKKRKAYQDHVLYVATLADRTSVYFGERYNAFLVRLSSAQAVR